MDVAKVYAMNGRSHSLQTSLISQMLTVFDAAGFADMIHPYDTVAIKLHCGDWNNTGYLRPVYARALADRIRELGGRPFVCDTITMPYTDYAYRVTGLDLLTTAARNGLNVATLGCPFIAADGYNGTDDVRIELPEGVILREAFIAKAIALADVVIALTHFKGHPLGVIGGSVKNLGIGAQSRRGKANVHMSGHPKYGWRAAIEYHPEKCVGKAECPDWQLCEASCPFGLFEVQEHGLKHDPSECRDCMICPNIRETCGVMTRPLDLWRDALTAQCAAMGDGALAVIKAVGRDKVGCINMAIDITPWCDCAAFSDAPILPNLGVLASRDPVALDQACLDLATEAAANESSMAGDKGVTEPGANKFQNVCTLIDGLSEEAQLKAAVENGLGTTEYELIEVDALADPKPFALRDDPRVVGLRVRHVFQREDPFRVETFGGRAFDRREEIDLSRFM